VLFFSEYVFDARTTAELKTLIFYASFIHTELLRGARQTTFDEHTANLVCENLIFRFPDEDTVDGNDLLSVPHWLLKCAYTQKGVLFGKFCKVEQDTSKDGVSIPSPPLHFISIRSALKPVDNRFFNKARILERSFRESEDDGEPVFDHLYQNTPIPPVLERIRMIRPQDLDRHACRTLLQELVRTDLYARAHAWAMSLLTQQG